MKLLHILAAAGLAVTSLAAAIPAEAQHLRDQPGWNDNRGGDHGRGWDRGHRGDRGHGWDRGRGHGWGRGGYGRRCHTEWRHHHRVRICR